MARLHALRCVLLAALAAAISAQSLDGSSAVSISPPPPEETSSPSISTSGNSNASDESEDRDEPNTETPPVPDSGGAGAGSNPPAPQETSDRPVDNPGIPPDPGIGAAAAISAQPVDGFPIAASTPPPPEESSSPSNTAWDNNNNNNNNNTSGSEDRNAYNTETPPMPDNTGSGFGYNARAPDDTDERIVGRAGVSRDSGGIGTGALVGIAAGAVATVALIVVFVRTSSARRASAAAAYDQQHLTHSQDLAMSTLSLKSVKVVDSSDAESPAPPSSRMPSTLLRKTFDATAHNKSSNSFSRVSGQQQSASHADDASLEFSIEEVFAPTSSQAAFTGMKSARSPKSAFRQSRISRPDEDDVYAAPSPVRSSQLRYSQSSQSSIQSTDSSMDVPMLDGGEGNLLWSSQRQHDHDDLDDHNDHDHNNHHDHDHETTDAHGTDGRESSRDIPVLARGSEESVDSIEEDEDVEISI